MAVFAEARTAYDTALINVGARDRIELSGKWRYHIDPNVPGDWNGQDLRLTWYDGLV